MAEKMEILVEKRRRGARSNQKLKILYLAKILLDNTDANHDITLQEIIDKLSANNVTAERKSLYDDIARLDEFGIKIKKTQYGKTYHYQVVKRDFELAELKLLVDSVAAAKFITEEKSNELIKKIEHLTSKHNATMLQRQVYVAGRVKSMNNGIMENVDAIHTAIAEKNKSGKKKNSTVADTTDSNKPPHDGMIYDVNAGTWIDMPEVHSDGFDRSEAEEVWSYVNAERTAAGLNALTWDEDIYNFACQRAQAIVSDFSHNGCGNYGENIALNSAGSAYRIHMQWFYSTGHHNNYMLSSYVKGACAIYVYQGVWYAVENFALEESENSGGTLSCNAYGLEAEAALNEYIDSHDW